MSFEIIVRPVAPVPVLKSGTLPPVITSSDDEAYIEWGTGSLSLASRNEIYDGNYSGWDGDGYGGVPDPGVGTPDPGELVFNETARTVHTVRVYNPENAANWVDVEVIDTLTFDFQGKVYTFKFTNTK